MKHTLLILALLCTLPCTAQKRELKKYYTFRASDKTPLYVDYFEADNSLWKSGFKKDTTAYMAIKDGNYIYYIDTTYSQKWLYATSYTQLNLDFNKNFEIHIRAKVEPPSGEEGGVGVLWWGKQTPETYIDAPRKAHLLAFSSFYNPVIAQRIYGSDKWYERSFYCYTFYKDDYNDYVIRKFKDYYYIFCNREFLQRMYCHTFSGNYMCLGVRPPAKLYVDYLKVYYLPNSLPEKK